MNQTAALIVTDEELDAIFNAPSIPGITCPAATAEGARIARSTWVDQVTTGTGPALTDKDLCKLATEKDPAGHLTTINALLEGLALRHAGDSVTLATVIAIQHFHLLNLMDDRDGELRDALMR